MPKGYSGKSATTMTKPCIRKGDPERFSRNVFDGFAFEARWKDAMDRFCQQANVFTETPRRSRMKKRNLLRMLDEIWDLIPERAQLVGRGDMPKEMLCRDWPEKRKKKEDAEE